jgi:hypothetical protein
MKKKRVAEKDDSFRAARCKVSARLRPSTGCSARVISGSYS